MKKYLCQICGYVLEGKDVPDKCPQCGAAKNKFEEQTGDLVWADGHVIGVVGKDTDAEILEGLRNNFNGECTEVGMY